jgi:alkylation response protein AidB-like acyl-CoA dehydrogenase
VPIEAKPGTRRDPVRVREAWSKMAAELGIGGLLVAEEHGGAGVTLIEAGRVAEVLSAELAAVPFLTAAVFAPVLLSAVSADGDRSLAAELLAGLAGGGTIIAVACAGAGESIVDASATSASGQFPLVLDGDVADTVILVGADGGELAVAGVADLEVTVRGPFDLTRGLADLRADGAPVRLLATGDAARAAYAQALSAARLALAADSAGGAQAALADAVEYARERIQFGREIGSFQAIKHLLADRFVDAELALSVARQAIEARVLGDPAAAEYRQLAAFYCADRFVAVAADDIQVHGGMGFTAECRAHLYRRRAAANRYLLGDPAELKAQYARTVIARSVTDRSVAERSVTEGGR